MPAFFIPALLGAIATVLGSMVGRILLALGIGFVTYQGFDLATTWLLNQIKASMAGIPTDILNFLAWLWVDRAVGLLFSAYTAALGIKTLGGTSMTKRVTKG